MKYLSILESGADPARRDPNRIVFDLERESADWRPPLLPPAAVVWVLSDSPIEQADQSVGIDLSADDTWVMRCDRIDFPPGGVAYTHTHPGPGIRRLLHGELEVTVGGETNVYGPGDTWFESGPDPVLAVATDAEPTAFVRVLVLPSEWKGRRTIEYVNPEDEDRPKLQTATIYLEVEVEGHDDA